MRRWVLAFQRFKTGLIIDINTDAVTAIIIAIKPIVEAGADIVRVDSDQVTILEIQIDITTGSRIITKTITTIITVTIITIRTDMHLSNAHNSHTNSNRKDRATNYHAS